MDETSALADLILPDLTYLESWGDYIPLADLGQKTIGLHHQQYLLFLRHAS